MRRASALVLCGLLAVAAGQVEGGHRREQVQLLSWKKQANAAAAATSGAASVPASAASSIAGGLGAAAAAGGKMFIGAGSSSGGGRPGLGRISSSAGIGVPQANRNKAAAAAKAPTTSSNKNEARLIPDGEVGMATNWGRSQTWNNVQVFHPETVDDVKRLIKQAKEQKRTLRPVGHTHSWSPILAQSNDMILVFDKMLGVEAEPNDPLLIKVGAGVDWGALARFSEDPKRGQYQFAYIPNCVISGTMSIVGTATTSSHGTAHSRSPFHDYLERLRIIDANGEERIYDKKKNPKEWSIAVSSFGLLGVVVEAWVRLEPFTKAVDFTAWKRPLDDFFPADPNDATAKRNLKELVEAYDSAIFTWVPMNGAEVSYMGPAPYAYTWNIKDDRITLRLTKRTDRQMPPYKADQTYKDVGFIPTDTGLYSWYSDDSLPTREQLENVHTLNEFYDMPSEVTTRPAFVAAYANKVTTSSVPASAASNISETYTMTFPASIHFQKHMDTIAASTDLSCIFKVDPDFGNILKLWAAMKQVVMKFEKAGVMPLNSFAAMRFVRGSEVNLSPFKGDPNKDLFAAIEVSAGLGALDFTNDLSQANGKSFVEELFKAWAAIQDPKTGAMKIHLAKWFDPWMSGGTQFSDTILGYARKELTELKAMAQQNDPAGLFQTKFFKDLFAKL